MESLHVGQWLECHLLARRHILEPAQLSKAFYFKPKLDESE